MVRTSGRPRYLSSVRDVYSSINLVYQIRLTSCQTLYKQSLSCCEMCLVYNVNNETVYHSQCCGKLFDFSALGLRRRHIIIRRYFVRFQGILVKF